jgi:hypothetical protein
VKKRLEERATDMSAAAFYGGRLARIWAQLYSRLRVAQANPRRFNPLVRTKESRAGKRRNRRKMGISSGRNGNTLPRVAAHNLCLGESL